MILNSMNCRLRVTASFWLCGILLVYIPVSLPAQSAEDVIDSPMYENPKLATSTTRKKFSPKLIPLWLQALGRPENEMKCRAAQAIVLAKHRGLTGLESTITPLLNVFDNPQQDASVRIACAQALI